MLGFGHNLFIEIMVQKMYFRLPSSQTSADKDSESSDSSVSSLSDRTDRQRAAFFYNPDRIRTADRIDTGKIRTYRNRTVVFYKIPVRIRTADRTGQDFPENQDKNETRTGHRQCCPATSGSCIRW